MAIPRCYVVDRYLLIIHVVAVGIAVWLQPCDILTSILKKLA